MDFYFVISDKNEGYPSIEELAEIPDTIPIAPYYAGIYIKDDKNNGYPHIKGLPDNSDTTMILPYPNGFMVCMAELNNGYPCIPQLYNIAGAFEGVQTLEYVRIPRTVKKIGKKSFAGTSLKKVKISADCTYYPTTFPTNCTIEFYE